MESVGYDKRATAIDPFDCTLDTWRDNEGSNYGVDGTPSPVDTLGAFGEEASAVQEGRVLGKEQGLEAGFREGELLGQRTGIDLGMEIGFALGLVEAVRNTILCTNEESAPSANLDRIRKSVEELEKAIANFPAHDEQIRKRLFRSTNTERSAKAQSLLLDEEDSFGGNEGSHKSRSDDNFPDEDVREKIQRIRARCKVLTAKLGIPRHSLKRVMEKAVESTQPSTRTDSGIPNKKVGDGDVDVSREW